MDEFCAEILRSVVIQLAQTAGFEKAQESAINTLTDVLREYLIELANATRGHTQMSGRTESNFFDMQIAFEDYGVSLDDLYLYVSEVDLILPSDISLSPLPAPPTKQIPLFETVPPPSFVPPFLINYPADVYYKSTGVALTREREPSVVQKSKLAEKWQVC
eukprot:c18249_g1_i1.p1 GENE.c18249_g1_i1~~c18249_g1_i1.p1  ORF type:complete len:175 (-),score=73.30 c18249_g1_i1:51-533(-)